MKILRGLFLLSALLCFFLFVQLLFTPSDVVAGFGIPASESANMIARRAGMLFGGVALINALVGIFSKRFMLVLLSLSMGLCWAGMAYLSFYEFSRSFASKAIVMPMSVEAGFAILMLGWPIVLFLRLSSKSVKQLSGKESDKTEN